VTVDLTTGLLGHASSSRRYKEEIKPMDKASETLYRLNPVAYRYKKEIDPTQSPAFGLIAEEVAQVNPELVACNAEGQPESVHYEMINAMLLNEFLKEHSKVEQQKAAIAELKSVVAQQQKEFQATIAEQRKKFEARLHEQDAKIQKVNDRIELNRTARQNLANND
jgi:Chaperone of endosialidase